MADGGRGHCECRAGLGFGDALDVQTTPSKSRCADGAVIGRARVVQLRARVRRLPSGFRVQWLRNQEVTLPCRVSGA